jgi:exodeoxyribonuclease VII small subunit
MSTRKKTTGPAEITFEDGYERMKEISAKLESADLTVAEMCESYAEGKGLGKALLAYLDEREGELKEIDEGKNLPAFEVIAKASVSPARELDAPNASDFDRATASGVPEDEIPF